MMGADIDSALQVISVLEADRREKQEIEKAGAVKCPEETPDKLRFLWRSSSLEMFPEDLICVRGEV